VDREQAREDLEGIKARLPSVLDVKFLRADLSEMMHLSDILAQKDHELLVNLMHARDVAK
jgi:hypothetical protein